MAHLAKSQSQKTSNQDKISPLSSPSTSPIPAPSTSLNPSLPPAPPSQSPPSSPSNQISLVLQTLQSASQQSNQKLLLETLHQFRSHLSCIPLPPPKPCSTSQAVKDLLRERVVLNGVRYLCQGSLFIETLKRLSKILCGSQKVNGSAGDTSGKFVTEAVMTRCARTTSGADSYEMVNKILGSPDLLLKPRSGQLPPIDIELYERNGSVMAAVSSTNCYGFYRFSDIEMMGNRMSMSSGDGENNDADSSSFGGGGFGGPWLSVDTVVVEKIDFRTGRSLRFLRIEIPQEGVGRDSDSPARNSIVCSP